MAFSEKFLFESIERLTDQNVRKMLCIPMYNILAVVFIKCTEWVSKGILS